GDFDVVHFLGNEPTGGRQRREGAFRRQPQAGRRRGELLSTGSGDAPRYRGPNPAAVVEARLQRHAGAGTDECLVREIVVACVLRAVVDADPWGNRPVVVAIEHADVAITFGDGGE